MTARVLGAASDLLRGVNGSLRGNYSGAPISLSDPTVDEFFNVTAFSIPAPGQFGDASRNTIPGPGARQLNGLFQRDVRLGGTRSLTFQISAINLLESADPHRLHQQQGAIAFRVVPVFGDRRHRVRGGRHEHRFI